MKILVNLTSLTNEGITPLYLRKIKELTKLNSKTDIFFGNKINKINFLKQDIYSFNQTSPLIHQLPYINHKLKFTFYCLFRNFQSIFTIFKYRHDYDVFYSPSSVLDLVITPFFAKIYNPKIIWTAVFDNVVPITDPGNKITRLISWLFFQISLLLIRKADLIFAISEELKQYLTKRGFASNKIVVTGNGLEIDLIKKAKKDKKYNYDALFVGRINETKGIFDMLKVLKQIILTIPNFRFAVIGNGDDATQKKFKKTINQLGLKKNVFILGYISGIKKFNIIKSSKCFWFLSVSKSESFGIALLEAVTCGIPAFAYNLPTYKNIYQHHEVNILPKSDIQAVSRAVLKLFQSQKFTNQNGPKLLNRYSWENIVKIEYRSIQKILN